MINYQKEGNFYQVTIDDDIYPQKLREIQDPPKELFCKGDLKLLNNYIVAIVGSRKCSDYGKTCAYQLGEKLAMNDITVASGLAIGIDSFGHKGGLLGKGSTIGVMATGILGCYPKQNQNLQNSIEAKGLLISEHPGLYTPQKFDFPRRNRIISGIADTVVIIEAGDQSGSLITAEYALEQNKNIFALPGNITSQYSHGTNRLIKEGACPLINFNDVIHDLGIVPREETAVKAMLGGDEQIIYQCVNQWGEVGKGYLIEATGFSPEKVNGLLSVLEIKGLIKYSLGKIYIAK